MSMDVVHRVSVVHVDRAMEAVAAFVSQVPNLPRWTRFYKQVGASNGQGHAVETLLGPARTVISEQSLSWGRRYTIRSTFPNRTERATLELRQREDGTQVRFHLRVPRALGSEHATRLMTMASQELLVLKDILEQPSRSSHPQSLAHP